MFYSYWILLKSCRIHLQLTCQWETWVLQPHGLYSLSADVAVPSIHISWTYIMYSFFLYTRKYSIDICNFFPEHRLFTQEISWLHFFLQQLCLSMMIILLKISAEVYSLIFSHPMYSSNGTVFFYPFFFFSLSEIVKLSAFFKWHWLPDLIVVLCFWLVLITVSS